MDEVQLKPSHPKPGVFIVQSYRHLGDSVPHWHLTIHSHVWKPPTDVYETENALVVRIEIAGMREEDFSIYLDNKYLQVRGLRSDTPERRAYHQMELRFGEFACDIELPFSVDNEKIDAVYAAGFLVITLPKLGVRHIDLVE